MRIDQKQAQAGSLEMEDSKSEGINHRSESTQEPQILPEKFHESNREEKGYAISQTQTIRSRGLTVEGMRESDIGHGT